MSDTITKPENVTTSAGLGDAITATASPRPWRVMYTRILDARGKSVCVCEKDSMHGRADDETAKFDAALIVEAVNERDRLRDIVRRLAESLDTAITVFGPLVATYRVSPPDPEPLHDTLCGVDITELLREAREAIGKGDK